MRSLVLLALVFSTAALAAQRKKEDAPIPYDDQSSDDDDRRRDLPKRSDESRDVAEETEVEKQDREISLASDDDPNIGISAEVVLGALLLDSSRAQGVEPLFMGGIRITWEWSRTLLTDEFWREVFFADITWFGSSARGSGGFGGTRDVYDSTNYHNFALAQGFAVPLGRTPLAFYGQAGIGFAWQSSSIYVQAAEPTTISVSRLLIQYGIGVRARIQLISDESFKANGYTGVPCITFRVEATRFRRGYMDDTLIGGSAGITF